MKKKFICQVKNPMVVHYLSDDSNFDEVIKMCKAEGVDTTAAELREFVKELKVSLSGSEMVA